MREWPLSSEEMASLRRAASQRLSMEKIVKKFSTRVESTFSSVFTHKATCPNPDHKGGGEKTPSFHFSEKDKQFYCFGCKKSGDVFDLLSMVLSKPVSQIINSYVSNKKISAHSVDVQKYKFVDEVNESKYKLCLELRNYLISLKKDSKYTVESEWVDMLFKQIDDRFSKLSDDDFKTAHTFILQKYVEIDRKKMELQ